MEVSFLESSLTTDALQISGTGAVTGTGKALPGRPRLNVNNNVKDEIMVKSTSPPLNAQDSSVSGKKRKHKCDVP